MSRLLLRSSLAALFILGFAWTILSADPPPQNSREKAVAAIVDLSNHLGDKDVSQRAKKLVAEHDSCDISTIFALKRRGGLGVGKLAQNDSQNSLQHFIPQLARRKNTTEQHFEENHEEYVRIAKAMQAMAELAPHRGAEFTRGNKAKEKEWADVSADFKKTTTEFRKAVESHEPKRVRLAAEALHHTCCTCHVLRD